MLMMYLGMIEAPEEQTKFELLYSVYYPTMLKAAASILRNQSDAEDAVHIAFMAIIGHLDKVGEIPSPKTKSYVLTIVESKAIDIYRENTKHSHADYEDVSVGFQIEYNGPVQLARCMAKLPAKYREVLSLKYHHGYNDNEIGQIMGITKENAKRLCSRAKVKLRQLCSEEGLYV